VARPEKAFREIAGADVPGLEPTANPFEQSNTSIVFGDSLILKFFRVLEPGPNPDLELGRYLSERGFASSPPIAGSIEYQAPNGATSAAAILQAFVPNQGDLFSYALEELRSFFDRAAAGPAAPATSVSSDALLAASMVEPPELVRDTIGGFLDTARLLGTRTGEMHLALGSNLDDPDFAPEPFSELYQRGVYQAIHGTVRESLRLLDRRMHAISGPAAAEARVVLGLAEQADQRLRTLFQGKLSARRIRIHGDFHAGQVMHTGRDLLILDFEGEPARPLSERRLKRSPIRDVAAMIRSFHYAAYGSLLRTEFGAAIRPEDAETLEAWVRAWYVWSSASFIAGHRAATAGTSIAPSDPAEYEILLDAFLVLKAFYELAYEHNNRPDWVEIPLRGIRQLLGR
jgi:maltose alpha-D-glucosyltransferase/alpha-amylase